MIYTEKDVTPGSLWRHLKTGSLYLALGAARCSTNGREEESSVVYLSFSTWEIYYREVRQFLDGRFVKVLEEKS